MKISLLAITVFLVLFSSSSGLFVEKLRVLIGEITDAFGISGAFGDESYYEDTYPTESDFYQVDNYYDELGTDQYGHDGPCGDLNCPQHVDYEDYGSSYNRQSKSRETSGRRRTESTGDSVDGQHVSNKTGLEPEGNTGTLDEQLGSFDGQPGVPDEIYNEPPNGAFVGQPGGLDSQTEVYERQPVVSEGVFDGHLGVMDIPSEASDGANDGAYDNQSGAGQTSSFVHSGANENHQIGDVSFDGQQGTIGEPEVIDEEYDGNDGGSRSRVEEDNVIRNEIIHVDVDGNRLYF